MMKLPLTIFCALTGPVLFGAVVEVTAFGAKGDGKADDLAAVSKAVEALKPGDTLRFPSGTYFLTGDVSLKTDRITVDGGGTLLFDHKPVKNRAMNKIDVTGKSITIRNLTITSNATSRSAVHGLISCKNTENILIDECDISKSPSVAVWTMNVANIRITNCFIHHQWADGIHISRYSRGVIIANNTIDFNGDDGIGVVSYHDKAPWNQLPRNENVLITGNIISNTPARGIWAWGGGLTITGNVIFNTGKAGIICSREGWISEKIQITSNRISNVGTAEKYGYDFYDSRGTRSGIHVQTNSNLLIADNIISGARNGGSGIQLVAAVDVTVTGNQISECSRGIQIDSPAHYATPEKKLPEELMKQIYASSTTVPEYAGSDNLLIADNFIKRMNRDGIYVTGSAARKVTNLVITNNFLAENNTGNHKFVRDIWADGLDHALIRGNFSAGSAAPNGLSPVQGIGKSCSRTVFERPAAPPAE